MLLAIDKPLELDWMPDMHGANTSTSCITTRATESLVMEGGNEVVRGVVGCRSRELQPVFKYAQNCTYSSREEAAQPFVGCRTELCKLADVILVHAIAQIM